MKRQQKGATLLEVLIVLAMCGIVIATIDGAIDDYKAQHARDSAPSIEFTGVK